MKALYLEWEDSCSLTGRVWHDQEADVEASKCMTAGFVIKEDKQAITIASHITPQGDMAGDITIPKRAITKRRVLRWKK